MLPHVMIMIHPNISYGRGVLEGIARYTREHGTFIARYNPWQANMPFKIDPQSQVIIAEIDTLELAEQLKATGLPVINISSNLLKLDFCHTVRTFEREVGMLIANDLLSRGFSNFAAVTQPGAGYSEERYAGFEQIMQKKGFKPSVFELSWSNPGMIKTTDKDLQQWLADLPKPIGLMAVNDLIGSRVIDLATSQGILIPESIAVIGVDNDPALCELSHPPLTSVEQSTDRIGYHAADLATKLLQGKPLKVTDLSIAVPPGELINRQSSNILKIADPDIARAAAYIRNHATEGINVKDILREIPLSRRTLELRFNQYLGRTPKAEIQRVQIQAAKALLNMTQLSMSKIAESCGFTSQTHFGQVFKNMTQLTPRAYRKAK